MDSKSDLARGVEERMVWEALYPCGESCDHLFKTPWLIVATKSWRWSFDSSFKKTSVSAVPGKLGAQLRDGASPGFLIVGTGCQAKERCSRTTPTHPDISMDSLFLLRCSCNCAGYTEEPEEFQQRCVIPPDSVEIESKRTICLLFVPQVVKKLWWHHGSYFRFTSNRNSMRICPIVPDNLISYRQCWHLYYLIKNK